MPMNRERPNELLAKQIVERRLGIQLDHADLHGGVDYLTSDGTVAVEVTAVTDGEKYGARKALRQSMNKEAPAVALQGCWLVFTGDAQARMKTFKQRVQPAIADLELAGETGFFGQRAAVHVLAQGSLSHIYRTLLDAGVQRASQELHEVGPDDPGHVHKLIVLMGSGGSVSGSDEALVRLVEKLRKKPDNPKKLRESNAEQRHLFVWVNFDTGFNIARPLQHKAPSWAGGEWGPPSVNPQLDPAITHLWVVHEDSRRGWLWNGAIWQGLTDL